MTDPTGGVAAESAGRAPAPFEFRKAAVLVEVTDYRATSLAQLLTGITLVTPASIFFHLHQRLFREPDRLAPFPNDFAEWADTVLGDAIVAERLANLNLLRSVDLERVRREISIILAEHIGTRTDVRTVVAEQAFVFCQPRFLIIPVGALARTPAEFLETLRQVDSDAVGFHLFVPRVLERASANDFARWFRAWGLEVLARQLDEFDPYLNSLEDNRAYLLELLERGLAEAAGATHA